MTKQHGFRFGIEAEFLLVDAESFEPLWHPDLTFESLNHAFEGIALDEVPSLQGLDLEPPHQKLMPFVVEGYHLPSPDLSPKGMLPKGVEIRTPICQSIQECLSTLATLYRRMQDALHSLDCQAVTCSHHPVEHTFQGPQNKRRHDFWQWAMEVMVTYGPDINVSLPTEMNQQLDVNDLHAKVNYYIPSLTALTLASPFRQGDLWRIRGRIGKSIRTYRRSVIAPAIEIHPDEDWRLELKPFEATPRLEDFHCYFLLWLTLLLDDTLQGRASNQSRIYDLGAIAIDGLEVPMIRERASEVLEKAPEILSKWGFDSAPLESFFRRLETGRLPSDELIELYQSTRSIPTVLRQLILCEMQAHVS